MRAEIWSRRIATTRSAIAPGVFKEAQRRTHLGDYAEWCGHNFSIRRPQSHDALTHTKGANTLADFQYQFKTVNDITQMIDGPGSHNHSYDSLDRLTEITSRACLMPGETTLDVRM